MGKGRNHNKKIICTKHKDLDLVQVKGAGRNIQVCSSPFILLMFSIQDFGIISIPF